MALELVQAQALDCELSGVTKEASDEHTNTEADAVSNSLDCELPSVVGVVVELSGASQAAPAEPPKAEADAVRNSLARDSGRNLPRVPPVVYDQKESKLPEPIPDVWHIGHYRKWHANPSFKAWWDARIELYACAKEHTESCRRAAHAVTMRFIDGIANRTLMGNANGEIEGRRKELCRACMDCLHSVRGHIYQKYYEIPELEKSGRKKEAQDVNEYLISTASQAWMIRHSD